MYGKLYTKLTGDVLLSSGVIAYLGAFTPLFREECARDWARRCREKGLPCSDEFSLAAVLADPVKVSDGSTSSLPTMRSSVQKRAGTL